MRFVFLVVVSIFCSIGCKKDDKIVPSNGELIISAGETDISNTIGYKTCLQTAYKGDDIILCFDSLIEDSRCPVGAVCTWQGRAMLKFSFTVNQDQRPITLSTFKLPGFPSDTILMGYKIEFVNLLPYPEIKKSHDLSEYTAEVKVTKQ